MYVEEVKQKKDICFMVCLFPNAFRRKSFFFSECKNILSKSF